MAIRIVGVDLPQNKRGEIALTYVYGIGRSSSAKILDKAGVDRDVKETKRCITRACSRYYSIWDCRGIGRRMVCDGQAAVHNGTGDRNCIGCGNGGQHGNRTSGCR